MNCAGIKSLQTCALLCFLLVCHRLVASELKAWIATWSTSPEAADHDPQRPELNLEGQTLRERFRISVGEPEIRIRLSNE
jgi:hypothetical protein